MRLDLTDSQVNVLLRAIDSYYTDLREEIYHTDDADIRQSLQDVEHTLSRLREQLEPGWRAHPDAGAAAAPPPA